MTQSHSEIRDLAILCALLLISGASVGAAAFIADISLF